jgi:hypothetical protein
MGRSACRRQLPPSPTLFYRPSSRSLSYWKPLPIPRTLKPLLTCHDALSKHPTFKPNLQTPISPYTTRQTTSLCASASSATPVDPVFNTSSSASYAYPTADVVHHEFHNGRCYGVKLLFFLFLFLMVMLVFQSHLFFCISFLLMLYYFSIWFNEIYSTHFACYFKKNYLIYLFQLCFAFNKK